MLGLGGLLLAAGCQQAPPAPTAKPAATTAAAASPTTAAAASPATSPVASSAASPVASPSASPAAAASPGPAGQQVAIDATDFAFGLPDTIAGGLVTLRLRNTGREPHHAQLLRLNPNVTIEQFMAALAQGPVPALQLASLEGGPAAVDPGGMSEVTLDLKEGQYVVACFIESPDGVPHLAKGMVRPIRVTAPAAGGTPPVAALTVTLKDFSFETPATVPAGRSTVRVTNAGPQPHEMAVVRIASGKALADVLGFLNAAPGTAPSGPPPFSSVGGMQGLGQGGAGFATLDLQPGDYAFVCQIPDPSSGQPHSALGMATMVTVR
jgi:hypothetical protein